MVHALKSHSRELDAVIERQIRNWEIARRQKLEAERAEKPVEEFIAISRAVGLPGEDVADALHHRLEWPVFDRQILQTMAGDDDYRSRLYATMDERDISWLEECLRAMGSDRYAAKNDYFHRLRETVLSLARKSHAIFVGRAADLILPSTVGLRVRLTARHETCVRQYAERNKISHDKAAHVVAELESERSKFISNHFGVEDADTARYDLVINMERFTAKQAVDLILVALRFHGVSA